jgi:enoyl-CoA hydratase/carnithine racemase
MSDHASTDKTAAPDEAARADRIVVDRDAEQGIVRITINRPEKRNSYDAAMRERIGEVLDEVALDDDIKVVLLRGEGGTFSAGADMGNAYGWYGEGTKQSGGAEAASGDTVGAPPKPPRRPSQRRRLSVDRKTFEFYHQLLGYPKVTVAEVNGLALGGGFEMALMADIAVVGRSTRIGMPATRFLGPALGSLHMFFHRLGPVLARRMLLTGDVIEAGELEHLGVFTEVMDDADVESRADWWARKVSRMPADGLVIAKEAFRLIEQTQAYQGEEVVSYLLHAYGTNLQFSEGEFNFVKTRAQVGPKKAFELRDEHFEIPWP